MNMVRIRVRSGELNKIVHKDMFLKEWTQKDVLDVIQDALDKEQRKELQLSDLTAVSEVPFDKERVYYISTKAALEQIGLIKKASCLVPKTTEVEK
jgi:hypothetical protein